MIGRWLCVSRLIGSVMALLMVTAVSAQQSDRAISGEHRLPCNGEVSLYYGDELIWRKAGREIRAIKDLVAVPDPQKPGMTGLKLSSLLALRPDVVAIELESCQPRLRRFERADIESDKGDGLYLIATNYRGFKLGNVAGQRRGGGGMKNIGRVVLVPAAAEVSVETVSDKTNSGAGGPGTGKGSGQGSGRNSGEKAGDDAGEVTSSQAR